MKRQVILYDFDNTLVGCESIWMLWRYAINRRKMSIFQIPIRATLGFFGFIFKRDFKYMKNAMVYPMKKLSEDDLKDFMTNCLYPKYFFKDGIKEFKSHDKDAVKILCSASATNYIKYVREILDFDHIIGTDLDSDFKVKSKNNKREIKVLRIKEYLEKNNIEIDYEISKAYSDSYKDDRFMMELVKNRYLINSKVKKEGYKNLTWR